MTAMSNDDQSQAIEAYLTSAPSSRLRGRTVEIRDSWRGRDNLLWRARVDGEDELVIKLFLDAGQARSRRQFGGHERFAPLRLAPAPRWYDRYPEGLSRQILVYEWMDGERPDAQDPGLDDPIADGIARIHAADPAEVQRFSPHPFNLATYWQIWRASRRPLTERAGEHKTPGLRAIFELLWDGAEALMGQSLPLFGETVPTPIHGELTPENMLLHRGTLSFVDWEFFGLGDPAQEIARFLLHQNADWEPERRRRFVESYSRQSPDPTLGERIEIYQRLLPFEAASSLLHGLVREVERDPAQRDELDQNLPFIAASVLHALERAARGLARGLSEAQHQAIDPDDESLQTEIARFLSPKSDSNSD